MTFKMKDIPSGECRKITVDGIEYEIYGTDNEQYGSYASVIIKDGLTGDRTYCNGIYENSKHRFLFRYDMEYNYNRGNYVYSSDLIIDVF